MDLFFPTKSGLKKDFAAAEMLFDVQRRHTDQKQTADHPRKGFTLIELLVVISIIGIIASIILASLSSARRRSRDVQRITSINSIRTGLELYFESARSYPVSTSTAGLTPTFLPLFPSDPQGLGGGYLYTAFRNDAGNASIVCTAGSSCLFYHVGATLEDNTTPALEVDANRCPAATADSNCRELSNTTVTGRNDDYLCDGTASSDNSCYDITPL